MLEQQQREIEAERAARRMAEADAAEMANIILDAAIWIDQLASTDGSGHRDLAHRLREIVYTRQHSGQALLAELGAARADQAMSASGLRTELDAARAVVAAARTGFGTEADIERAYAFDPNLLTARIRAYDEATKARGE